LRSIPRRAKAKAMRAGSERKCPAAWQDSSESPAVFPAQHDIGSVAYIRLRLGAGQKRHTTSRRSTAPKFPYATPFGDRLQGIPPAPRPADPLTRLEARARFLVFLQTYLSKC